MTRHLPEHERRAQILRAARHVFLAKGYNATRIEDIAARARLSKGAVYFYFDSKRAIFDALVDEDAASGTPPQSPLALLDKPMLLLLLTEALRDAAHWKRATRIWPD